MPAGRNDPDHYSFKPKASALAARQHVLRATLPYRRGGVPRPGRRPAQARSRSPIGAGASGSGAEPVTESRAEPTAGLARRSSLRVRPHSASARRVLVGVAEGRVVVTRRARELAGRSTVRAPSAPGSSALSGAGPALLVAVALVVALSSILSSISHRRIATPSRALTTRSSRLSKSSRARHPTSGRLLPVRLGI